MNFKYGYMLRNSSISLVVFFLCAAGAAAQPSLKETVRRQSMVAGQLEGAIEGFSRKLSGEEIAYHSTRQDAQPALLVRATDGSMSVSWETPVIVPAEKSGFVQLFLIAGMSLEGYSTAGVDPGFRVSIGDRPYFHFRTSLGESWSVDGPDGSRMIFQTVIRDQANDGFGYARIVLPKSTLESGKSLKIKITGDASGSRHWFMVFQYPDALQWFRNKTAVDGWFDIRLSQTAAAYSGKIVLPGMQDGTGFKLTSGGKPVKVSVQGASGKSSTVFTLPNDAVSLTVEAPGGIVLKDIRLGEAVSRSIVEPDRLISYQVSAPANGETLIEVQASASNVSEDLRKIASAGISDGKMLIMASSHQDIAWMDSPQACVDNRDNLLITPALGILESNPAYYNDMEDILMLREYLTRHPEKKDLIYRLTREGRLTWGASFIQPYEEMYFGEALLRQFYLGRRWFRKEFPGCDARIYWNVDVPGRTLQMPQILAGSGVPYMIISRHERGMFHWNAPDGSSVLSFSPGHYYNSWVNLKKGFFESVSHFADLAGFWGKYYGPGTALPVVPVLSDADMAVPDSYFHYIDTWNSLRDSSLKLPDLEHSTAERFMDAAVATGAPFPVIQGERPAVWLYIHGPSHYEALKAGRSAGRMLPAAEKMASFRSLVTGNWDQYPAERLEKAWESAIYPDHGWGGKNGDITDQTFLDKFREADQGARAVIEESTRDIAGRISPAREGMPLVVFNSLSWERTDPVETRLELPDKSFKWIRLSDTDGKAIEFQVTGTPEFYPSGYLKAIPLVFIAEKIPSLGYKTYYTESAKKTDKPDFAAGLPDIIETDYYRIRFGQGGISSIFDKSLQKEVLNSDKFSAGELFSMQSVGNGAGEFSDIQQPDTTDFEKPGIEGAWTVTDQGPVRLVISGSMVMKHNRAAITWTIYPALRRIDITADLIDWDGTAYREFRLAFPAGLQDPEIAYEVPFGVVRVGKDELAQPAGERYTSMCKDIHPRGINNWISANDSEIGVTIASGVAVWDYVNMTGLKTGATLLQPVLLASRQSCHGEGPLYHQKGSHSIKFSLFTHKPGWQNGYRQALQANEELFTVFNANKLESLLPDKVSFLELDDPNVPVSTVKKAEDDNSLIVRFYDQEGRDKSVGMKFFKSPDSVEKTNLIEDSGEKVGIGEKGLKVRLGHHAISTYKLGFN
jgi:alpha-mannosidase